MGAANSKKREVAFVDACARGDTAEAMLLLDKAPAKHRPKLLGAYSVHTHMHLRSVQRKSALAVAALGGHTETAMALLDAGADIDLKVGSHGFSALMWACYRGHADVVQALIDRRADLEVESYPEKETAFLTAAEAGQVEVLKLLVTAGADVHKRKINGDARRPNGVSALELAKERDEDAVVAYLEELAAAGVTVMVPAGEGEAVTDITSTPRSPGATADARRAALEAAAHGGSARAIAQLAKMGSSDADQPDVEPPSLATTRTTAGETEAPLIELIYPDGWCGLGPRVPQLPAGAAAANDAADLDFVREVFGRVRVPPPLLSACKRAAELCEGVAAGDVAEGVAAGAAASMQALVEWVEADEAAPRPEGCAKVPPFVNLRLLALAMHGATKGRASAGKDLFVRCQEAWAGPLADGGPRLLFVPCLAALEKLTARMVALIERVRAHPDHDEQAMLMVWLCGGGDYFHDGEYVESTADEHAQDVSAKPAEPVDVSEASPAQGLYHENDIGCNGMSPLRMSIDQVIIFSREEAFENDRADAMVALCLKAMEQGDAIVNGKDHYGDTMFHLAANLSSTAMVEELVRRGSTMLDKANDNGCTPLHSGAMDAKKNSPLGALEAMIQHGANVNCTVTSSPWSTWSTGDPIEGKTPLHYGARNNVHELVDMLLAAGADPNAKDAAGEKPSEMAEEEDMKAKLTAAEEAGH